MLQTASLRGCWTETSVALVLGVYLQRSDRQRDGRTASLKTEWILNFKIAVDIATV